MAGAGTYLLKAMYMHADVKPEQASLLEVELSGCAVCSLSQYFIIFVVFVQMCYFPSFRTFSVPSPAEAKTNMTHLKRFKSKFFTRKPRPLM